MPTLAWNKLEISTFSHSNRESCYRPDGAAVPTGSDLLPKQLTQNILFLDGQTHLWAHHAGNVAKTNPNVVFLDFYPILFDSPAVLRPLDLLALLSLLLLYLLSNLRKDSVHLNRCDNEEELFEVSHLLLCQFPSWPVLTETVVECGLEKLVGVG